MTRTIAVVNHKGGSTKTTSTVNLAQALVEAGYTVRVIDLDPQCNATSMSTDRTSLSTASGVAPSQVVALHCGSRSTTRTV